MSDVIVIELGKKPYIKNKDQVLQEFSLTEKKLDNLIDTGNEFDFENKKYCFDYPVMYEVE